MTRQFRKFLLLLLGIFLFLFFISVQQSFLNPSYIGFNLILILTIILAVMRSSNEALVFAWLCGIFAGISHFSGPGMSSLILLIITAFLIMLRKTAFFTLKTESIILLGVIAVFLQRLLIWIVLGTSPTLNWTGFIVELIITPLILVLLFNIKRIRNLKQVNA